MPNRLIHRLEEFGPHYFDLSRIMRISANTYRQNSHKLAGAVKALREQSAAGGTIAKPAEKGTAAARRRLKAAVVEMTHLFEDGLEVTEREELVSAINASLGDLRAL
jgi:hypothetical protein